MPALVAGLAWTLAETKLQYATIVGIPSTNPKVLERGFETIAPLAQKVAKIRNWPYQSALTFAHPVSEQVGLTNLNRRRNLANAFVASAPISGTVVLVDDVVTTGATVSAAADALRIAGAQTILQICLCRV